jgi:hypothetical protein
VAKNKKKSVPSSALKEKAKPKKVWKEPTLSAMPAPDGRMPMAWRFSHRDMSGPFGWAEITQDDLTFIMGKLVDFETKTWDQASCGWMPPDANFNS